MFFQVIAFAALGLVLLVAGLHAPRGVGARIAYGVLALIPALAGIGIATRHVWLTHLPAAVQPVVQWIGQLFALIHDNWQLVAKLAGAFLAWGALSPFLGWLMPLIGAFGGLAGALLGLIPIFGPFLAALGGPLLLLGALALVPVAREKLRGLLNPRPGAPGQDG